MSDEQPCPKCGKSIGIFEIANAYEWGKNWSWGGGTGFVSMPCPQCETQLKIKVNIVSVEKE